MALPLLRLLRKIGPGTRTHQPWETVALVKWRGVVAPLGVEDMRRPAATNHGFLASYWPFAVRLRYRSALPSIDVALPPAARRMASPAAVSHSIVSPIRG